MLSANYVPESSVPSLPWHESATINNLIEQMMDPHSKGKGASQQPNSCQVGSAQWHSHLTTEMSHFSLHHAVSKRYLFSTGRNVTKMSSILQVLRIG